MVIIRIKGGLGNQLFQYASAFSLAKRLNTELKLDTSFYPQQTLRGFKLDKLEVDFREIYEPEKWVEILKNKYINKGLRKANIKEIPIGTNAIYLLETRSDIVEQFFTIKKDKIYVDGYYQSEKYFAEYRDTLLQQFVPSYKPEEEYSYVLEEIKNTLSVGVHVRRGDFIKGANDSNPNHYLLGEQYYHNALRYMSEKLPTSAVYYWFSDDIEWVKSCFGEKENFRFVSLHTKNGDIDEMQVMKRCQHIIAANSTFSWWAAWLNENPKAIKTVPEKRFGNLHMIPNGWIRLPVE